MILLLDNNDSFTYNLVQIFEELNIKIIVVSKDYLNTVNMNNYKGIVLSPGPEIPEKYPQMMNLIDKYYKSKPILGICLGHQALSIYFGAKLFQMPEIKHGISSKLNILSRNCIYSGIDGCINVGRYHSWSVKSPLPDNIICTAISDDNVIMSIKHKRYNITGIQYHPESIITENGSKIIENWLNSIN